MAITKSELKTVLFLQNEKKGIEDVLGSFDSVHVRCCVGLVDENASAKHDPKASKHAAFFHREFKKLGDQMTKEVRMALEHRKEQIEFELSKYITPERKQ